MSRTRRGKKKSGSPSRSRGVQAPSGPPARWWDRWVDRVPFLARRRVTVSRQEILASIPVRNERIEWELKRPDGEEESALPVAVLRVPRRQDRLGKVMNRLFEGPSHRQVILDELGTDVWELCDGENSIEGLIRELARRHKLERREVEVSLTTYLKTLTQRGFIGLRSPSPPESTE